MAVAQATARHWLLALLGAVLAAPWCAAGFRARGAGSAGAAAGSLLQTYDRALGAAASGAHDTPVTRVVNLLKEMQGTLQKEMDEDEALYKKLKCWCNTNSYDKTNAIKDSEAKIDELSSDIEGLTAKSAGLETGIKELTAEYTADKAALEEATALREKEAAEFHGSEMDLVQNIENLKAAITILGKFHGEGVFPQLAVSLLEVGRAKDQPWADSVGTHLTHSLDEFMMRHGFDDTDGPAPAAARPQKFLQQSGAGQDQASAAGATAAGAAVMSTEDVAVVRRAVRSASAFMQAHHGERYMPSYAAQSGEIYGILKQMKEEMEAELSQKQKAETSSAGAFTDLRSAKTAQIENGEQMTERKEDELATTDNLLAEGKEDKGQETAALEEAQTFMKNLEATCSEADANFDERKKSRLAEMEAVAETITILTEDEARDTMTRTYSLLQRSSSSRSSGESLRRRQAAAALRAASSSPEFSALATSVELDAFTKVKAAIDKMIAQLQTQQKDEVKKNDWCKDEIQENEMTTAKTEDLKADLTAKEAELASEIKTLTDGIATAKSQIAELQLELQRASEDRKAENLEFQKTVADQAVVVEVLKKALDRLANYYDKEALLQKSSQSQARRQTPPVPQMEYKPSKGAAGVQEMIQKLIFEAQGLTKESQKAEGEAQAAYETLVADTNGSVAALAKQIAAKSKAKASAKKEKLQTASDIADTTKELEGLSKENGELHVECDYLLKNFDARQEARGQEIEALQQAKQILSGAALS